MPLLRTLPDLSLPSLTHCLYEWFEGGTTSGLSEKEGEESHWAAPRSGSLPEGVCESVCV